MGARLTPAARCRRKFLHYFPGGFRDETYLDWERDYKWKAHRQWVGLLGAETMKHLPAAEVAARAIRIESRTNLLFSFEKMALRDAVRPPAGSRAFADALAQFLRGSGALEVRFEHWCAAIGSLPRVQTRVLTWPVVTVFGFLAQPKVHLYLKPTVTKRAARAYGFDFEYASKPAWPTYRSLLAFGAQVRRDLADLAPRDQVDIQSFLWVQGSDEYPD
jgi:hypothetical protein